MRKNLRNKLQIKNCELRIEKLFSVVCNMIFAIGLSVLILFTGCTNRKEIHTETYTCPMHPTIISDKPGTCPVCGMTLVLKTQANKGGESIEDLDQLFNSTNEPIVSSVKTIKGQYKSVPVSIDALGIITYDTRNIYNISARVDARLEKIYLNSVFQHVSKGQKIADIYSPELITAQRELIFLLDNDAENKTLINIAKDNLERLGLSSVQIQSVINKKTVNNTFSIYSPYNGYMVNDQQAPSTSIAIVSSPASSNKAMGEGMDAKSSNEQNSASYTESSATGSLIKEGNYVSAGQILFSIVNAEALRIELDLPIVHSGAIKQGDTLELDYKNGNKEKTTVDFVQPFFNKGESFLKLRVNTKKVEDLHIGHLVNANIRLTPFESLWVPRESVLDLGNSKIVFIKDRTILKAKKVYTGVTSHNLIEIISGITSSDNIAANAQYLVDSESFIKTVK